MASILGYKGAFGLQEEISYKGTVTGSIVYEKLTSHNMNTNNNFYRPDLIDNDFNRTEGTYGAYSVDGDLGGDCVPSDFFGMLLYGVFGSVTAFSATTTGGSGTITEMPHHTFGQAQTLPSFMGVYQIGDSGDKLDIHGIKFDSLTLNGSKDSPVTWSANYLAGYDEDRTSTITVSLPSQDRFMFYQMSITIDGSTDKNIESFSFSINNNLEVLRYLEVARRREASAIERTGKTDLSLSLDVNYETLTTYQEFWGNSSASYAAESATRYSITIACNGFRYQTSPELRYRLILTLPACEINSAPIPQSTGRVIQTLDLTPVKASGKSYAVQCELYNERGTTYA